MSESTWELAKLFNNSRNVAHEFDLQYSHKQAPLEMLIVGEIMS